MGRWGGELGKFDIPGEESMDRYYYWAESAVRPESIMIMWIYSDLTFPFYFRIVRKLEHKISTPAMFDDAAKNELRNDLQKLSKDDLDELEAIVALDTASCEMSKRSRQLRKDFQVDKDDLDDRARILEAFWKEVKAARL